MKKGISLVECLVFISVALILSIILVPNYRLHQVRSQVSQTLSDFHTLSIAIDLYKTINNASSKKSVGEFRFR